MEEFRVLLSGATNTTISDSLGQATINPDDFPLVNIAAASTTEGNSGIKTLTFTVSIAQAVVAPVSVGYYTLNTGTGGTNAIGTFTCGGTVDYQSRNYTTDIVTIPAGSTSATLGITICGETTSEGNETFKVRLRTPSFATIGVGDGLGTITNDD